MTGESRDRTAPQVVAIRESARKDRRVDVGQDRIGVPQRHRVTTSDPYSTLGVAVVEAARKCHHTDPRGHQTRLLGRPVGPAAGIVQPGSWPDLTDGSCRLDPIRTIPEQAVRHAVG
jgi:hypothetical protein